VALTLVPRSARALADQLNGYFRVLRGVDPDSLAVRLPSAGSFRVNHSVSGSPVLLVTDAGLDGATLKAGSIQSASIATGAPITPGSVTNAEIADGTVRTQELAATPHVIVTRSSGQAISHSTVTALTWNIDVYDSGGLHDTASNLALLVAPIAGLYLVTLWLWWDPGTVGERFATILLQSTTPIGSSRINNVAGTYTEQTVTAYTRMTAGQYVSASCHQTNGGQLQVRADSRFSMAWISN
jgi:hypothetical protein